VLAPVVARIKSRDPHSQCEFHPVVLAVGDPA
jgi:hypothetical protein